MSKRLLASIAVIAGIAGIAGVAWRCRSGEAPTVVRDAAVAPPLTKARLRLRDLQRQRPGTVHGTVRGDGAPVAAATVCAQPADDAADIRCVATDGAGGYTLSELRPAAYVVWASAPGFAGASWRAGEVDRVIVKTGEARAGIDFALRRGGAELAGRIRDTRGREVGGATVHVRVEGVPVATTRSDARGVFTVRVDGSEASVEATADGYVDASTRVVVPATALELVMLAEARLAGIVVEAGTRTPIADARVWIDGSHVTTGDDGTFEARKLRPGRYKPTASSVGGYGEAAESVLLRVGARVDGVVVEIHPVAVVAGRIVVEGSEQGCPEGSVQLERRGSREFAFGRTVDGGDVLIEGVVPGVYAVRLACSGYVAAPSYPDLQVAGTDVEDVVWRVKPGTRLAGRVLAKGAPVADATVIVSAGLGNGARVRTAADGTFEVSGLPPGELGVEAAAVGYATSPEVRAVTALDHVARVELVLGPRTGSLAGKVIDRAGAPLANLRVELRTGDAASGPGAHTDLRGEFEVTGLDAGTYQVVVESDWQLSAVDSRTLGTPTRVTLARGDTARVVLQVDPEASRIAGTVVDARGAPLADVEVDAALTSPDVEPRRRNWGRSVWTSATGGFELAGIPDLPVAVRARIAGANEAVVDDVRPGQHVRLVMQETGVLAGVVIDPSGASVDDISLEVEDRAQDLARRERLYFTGGRFQLRDLPAGTYRLTADEDRQTSITVTLAAGERREGLQLSLRPRHAIRGRLVSASGKPLANYKLEVPHKEAVERTGTRMVATYEVEYGVTDARGEFLIEGLVGAEVTISAGDLAAAADPAMVEVKTVALSGPPTIDLGDLVLRDVK